MTQLSSRAVNRATLARQMLLERASISVPEAIERLVGMQAQAPFPPYTGLWTRLADFRPDDLAKPLIDRGVVRVVLMRSTVHLVTAADCLALRPVVQPMLERALRGSYGKQLEGLDLEAVAAFARELVEEKPRGTTELARLLLGRWPDRDRSALGNTARTLLPLVQVPPRAVWGKSGHPTVTTADSWLDRPLATETAPDAMVLRYFGAFGPATVGDAQKWSGLTRLQEVVDRLGPKLRVFRDERGAELYDLPDAPRPDPGTPAPVRFLPEFDNLLLSYVDGGRVLAREHRPALFTVNGIIRSAVLVDGVAQAVWKITRAKRAARLVVEPLTPLSPGQRSAIEDEGARLLAFAAADAGTHDIEFSAP
ncbi:winged helix DNA-binding domain-containing protein [Sphaerisporangium perillae]|uniref:winged helix DNA-binding domain-containing protein n=1 Tax=Sphaerisporangium perillae TaxID=2935860 RepID=UPI00200E087C|nr:winged helix DNA-binding domain-containing protein [Sphaerisporangium perillae]